MIPDAATTVVPVGQIVSTQRQAHLATWGSAVRVKQSSECVSKTEQLFVTTRGTAMKADARDSCRSHHDRL